MAFPLIDAATTALNTALSDKLATQAAHVQKAEALVKATAEDAKATSENTTADAGIVAAQEGVVKAISDTVAGIVNPPPVVAPAVV